MNGRGQVLRVRECFIQHFFARGRLSGGQTMLDRTELAETVSRGSQGMLSERGGITEVVFGASVHAGLQPLERVPSSEGTPSRLGVPMSDRDRVS